MYYDLSFIFKQEYRCSTHYWYFLEMSQKYPYPNAAELYNISFTLI